MDATDVIEVCRLCPSSGGGQQLLHIFNKNISFKYNIKEVILMNTGIEILENDLVSKKICQRCCNILYKMYEFRLDALKQDQKLKDKCGQYLGDKGIRLPNTCITIKKEKYNLSDKKIKQDPDRIRPSTSKEDLKKILHPSVEEQPSTSRENFNKKLHLSVAEQPSTSREDLKKKLHPSLAEQASTPPTSREHLSKKLYLSVTEQPSTSRDLKMKLHYSVAEQPSTPSTSREDLTRKLHPSVTEQPSTNKDLKKKLHPSVADAFRKYPTYKLPKKCFERHIAPVVSLSMGEVEAYFKKRKLNFKKFIYKPSTKPEASKKVAKKRTSLPAKEKTVAPLKISKKLFEIGIPGKSTDSYFSVSKEPNRRKRKTSSDSDRTLESKLYRNKQPKVSLPPEASAETSKPTLNKQPNASHSPQSSAETSKPTLNKQPKASLPPQSSAEISKSTLNKHPKASLPPQSSAETSKPTLNKQPKASLPPHSSAETSKPTLNKQPKASFPPHSSAETSKPTLNKPDIIKTPHPVSNLTNGVYETPRTPSPEPVNLTPDSSRAPSPAAFEPVSEDSRDTWLTNTSKATTSSNASQPDFMESFGLTPTVTATKSHTLLVCPLCGSVHQTALELKRHAGQHRMCQFCKMKFKSVESKQNHVDNLCPIKKVMNSSGPVVRLEKVDFNLEIRKKYRNTFTDFDLIPGLVEPTPVEQVILQAASPPPFNAADAVIVLSDDEDEIPTIPTDPLSGIPTPSANMPPPAAENIVYTTVSIVRPKISIKKDTALNNLVENMTDKDLLKRLIELLKPPDPPAAEKVLQTDLPTGKDIKVNHSDGTCEFKDLKGQLATYKIPINISNGPFHAAYKYNVRPKTNKSLALWNNLPVVDIQEKTSFKPPSVLKSPLTTPSSKSSSIDPVQVQTSDVTVASVPIITNITSSGTIIQAVPTVPSSSGLVTINTAVPNRPTEVSYSTIPITSIIPINTTNSATPLLQNYALSMTSAPVIMNPVPIPRTYINSALSNTVSTSNRTVISAVGNSVFSRSPSVTISYNRPQPANNVNFKRPTINGSAAPSSSLSGALNLINTSIVLTPPSASSYSTNTSLPVTTALAQPTANLLTSSGINTSAPSVSGHNLLISSGTNFSAVPVVSGTNFLTSAGNYCSSSPSVSGNPLLSYVTTNSSATSAASGNNILTPVEINSCATPSVSGHNQVPSEKANSNATPPVSGNNTLTSAGIISSSTPTVSAHTIPSAGINSSATPTVSENNLLTSAGTNSSATPGSGPTTKFRVKNVWELQ